MAGRLTCKRLTVAEIQVPDAVAPNATSPLVDPTPAPIDAGFDDGPIFIEPDPIFIEPDEPPDDFWHEQPPANGWGDDDESLVEPTPKPITPPVGDDVITTNIPQVIGIETNYPPEPSPTIPPVEAQPTDAPGAPQPGAPQPGNPGTQITPGQSPDQVRPTISPTVLQPSNPGATPGQDQDQDQGQGQDQNPKPNPNQNHNQNQNQNPSQNQNQNQNHNQNQNENHSQNQNQNQNQNGGRPEQKPHGPHAPEISNPDTKPSVPSNQGQGQPGELGAGKPLEETVSTPKEAPVNSLLNDIITRIGKAQPASQPTPPAPNTRSATENDAQPQPSFATNVGPVQGSDPTQAPQTPGATPAQPTLAAGDIITLESTTLTLSPGLSTTVGAGTQATFLGIATNSAGQTLITVSSSGTAVTATVTNAPATVTRPKTGFDASITAFAGPARPTAGRGDVVATTSSRGAAGGGVRVDGWAGVLAGVVGVLYVL
jgi:hypothetical protein